MKKLSTRQAGIMIIVGFISLKFLTFPALYALQAGVDGYLGILSALVLDLIIIALVLYASYKNPNKTFTQIISSFFGQFTGKVINFIMFLLILLKGIFLLKEYHNYLLDTLFSYFTLPFFLLPVLAFIAFFMTRSLRSIGRSLEIFFPLIIIALLIAYFLPFDNFEFANLLPFMENGPTAIFKSGYFCSFASGDFIVLLLIVGKFEVNKNTHKKLFNYSLVGALLVFVFYVIFFGVFGSMATNQALAIGDLPLYVSFPATVGRIDWITINLWTVTLLMQLGMFFSFSLYCFNVTFNLKNKNFGIIFIIFIAYLGANVSNFDLPSFIRIVTSPTVINANLIIYIFPILMVVSTIVKMYKEKKEKTKYVGINKKVFSK